MAGPFAVHCCLDCRCHCSLVLVTGSTGTVALPRDELSSASAQARCVAVVERRGDRATVERRGDCAAMGADPAAVRARVDILLRADKSNEPATIRAMQQLFSMCRSKTKEHLANQAAAADAGGVRALLRLVDVGSLKQRCLSLMLSPNATTNLCLIPAAFRRMWALNTLGRLCFDHPENAAEVCRSREKVILGCRTEKETQLA